MTSELSLVPAHQTAFLQVPDWPEFTPYKDREPNWIKIKGAWLDDPHFFELSDEAKGHLFAIWLLASRCGNRLKNDARYIAQRIGATSLVDLDHFVSCGLLEPYAGSVQLAESSVRKSVTRRKEGPKEGPKDARADAHASSDDSEEAPALDARLCVILGSIPKDGYRDKLTAERMAALIEQFPHVTPDELVAEAKALFDWEVHGKGARLKTADGISRLRNWLKRAYPTGQPAAPTSVGEAEQPEYPKLPAGETF